VPLHPACLMHYVFIYKQVDVCLDSKVSSHKSPKLVVERKDAERMERM